MAMAGLTPEQVAFEAEFSKWEQSFEDWKMTFSCAADPELYNRYEKRFLDIRDKLLIKKAHVYKSTSIVDMADQFEQHLRAAETMAKDIINNPEFSTIAERGKLLSDAPVEPRVPAIVENFDPTVNPFGRPGDPGSCYPRETYHISYGPRYPGGHRSQFPAPTSLAHPRQEFPGGLQSSRFDYPRTFRPTGEWSPIDYQYRRHRPRFPPRADFSSPPPRISRFSMRGSPHHPRFHPYPGPMFMPPDYDPVYEKFKDLLEKAKTEECPKLSTTSKKYLQRLNVVPEENWSKADKQFMEYVRHVRWKRAEFFKAKVDANPIAGRPADYTFEAGESSKTVDRPATTETCTSVTATSNVSETSVLIKSEPVDPISEVQPTSNIPLSAAELEAEETERKFLETSV